LHEFDINTEVLILQIGLICALPFLLMWLMMAVGGLVANVLLTKRILSTTTVRQVFNTVGQSFCFVFVFFSTRPLPTYWLSTSLDRFVTETVRPIAV
jgi:hypothetical protein